MARTPNQKNAMRDRRLDLITFLNQKPGENIQAGENTRLTREFFTGLRDGMADDLHLAHCIEVTGNPDPTLRQIQSANFPDSSLTDRKTWIMIANAALLGTALTWLNQQNPMAVTEISASELPDSLDYDSEKVGLYLNIHQPDRRGFVLWTYQVEPGARKIPAWEWTLGERGLDGNREKDVLAFMGDQDEWARTFLTIADLCANIGDPYRPHLSWNTKITDGNVDFNCILEPPYGEIVDRLSQTPHPDETGTPLATKPGKPK